MEISIVCLPFTSQSNFLGNVSAIMDPWEEAANEWTHFRLMSCSRVVFHTHPTCTHIAQIPLPSCRVSYWWSSTECYSITQMVQRNSNTHAIALDTQTERHFVISGGSPATWRGTTWTWIDFLMVFNCLFFWVCFCSRAWLPDVIYCMWQYVLAISLSKVPCFPLTGTKRHKLHYYLCKTIE